MIYAVKLPLVSHVDFDLSGEGQSRILNWARNSLLELVNLKKVEYQRTKDPEIGKLIYSKYGLRNLLPELKTKYPFLRTVHSAPLKNAALNLSASIKRYQDDKKKPKHLQSKVGWPKFRSVKKKFFSLLYDEPGNGFQFRFDETGWSLDVSFGVTKEGERISHRVLIKEMPAWLSKEILNAQKHYVEKRRALSPADRKKFHLRKLLPFTELRLKKEGSEWFAILSVERPDSPSVVDIKKIAVIDPNHKNFGYLVDSDGNAIEIERLGIVKALDKRIDEIKARRDNCKKNSVRVVREDGSELYKASKKWKFFQDYLDELHRVRREQMKQALYTIANGLTRTYDFIAIGNYTSRGGGINTGMRRSMNNQSQIGKFKHILKWVCQKTQKSYHEWDEKNSTKTCHRHGLQTDLTKDPSIRSWKCDLCDISHIRDENAALNGSRLAIDWIKQNNLPCSGQCDTIVKHEKYFTVSSRWAWRFNGSGITVSRASECIELQAPGN